jgi:RNA recognition motif-containing protein
MARILSDQEEPVHIIMERVTSKTMDAFVEFESLDDAMRAVERHRFNLANGRASRLGDRPVEVELASQGALMADLFPITRGVEWDGVNPKFRPFNPKEPWENFRGFVSEEEMTMLIKHVEVPHRVGLSPMPPFLVCCLLF